MDQSMHHTAWPSHASEPEPLLQHGRPLLLPAPDRRLQLFHGKHYVLTPCWELRSQLDRTLPDALNRRNGLRQHQRQVGGGRAWGGGGGGGRRRFGRQRAWVGRAIGRPCRRWTTRAPSTRWQTPSVAPCRSCARRSAAPPGSIPSPGPLRATPLVRRVPRSGVGPGGDVRRATMGVGSAAANGRASGSPGSSQRGPWLTGSSSSGRLSIASQCSWNATCEPFRTRSAARSGVTSFSHTQIARCSRRGVAWKSDRETWPSASSSGRGRRGISQQRSAEQG